MYATCCLSWLSVPWPSSGWPVPCDGIPDSTRLYEDARLGPSSEGGHFRMTESSSGHDLRMPGDLVANKPERCPFGHSLARAARQDQGMDDADDCRQWAELEAQARAQAEKDLPPGEGWEQIKRALAKAREKLGGHDVQVHDVPGSCTALPQTPPGRVARPPFGPLPRCRAVRQDRLCTDRAPDAARRPHHGASALLPRLLRQGAP